jgi:hypothetical protein
MEDTLDKTSVEAIQRSEQEKPRNGIKGLIHWNQDLTAGAIVALVSMPLSLAVAVASGAPPVAGFITAIVAGFGFTAYWRNLRDHKWSSGWNGSCFVRSNIFFG